MISFDDAMVRTRSVSSHTVLSDEEARVLYNCAAQTRAGGMVVEIGCQYGRSSVLIAQIAQSVPFHSIHIDPFPGHPEVAAEWIRAIHPLPVTLLHMPTSAAVPFLQRLAPFDFAFIDGDHEYEGVRIDLHLVASRIRPGGFLCMHDYGNDGLPGVYRALRDYMVDHAPEWTPAGQVEMMAVWERL